MKKNLRTTKSVIKMVILILVAVVQLFPFIWLILFSLKSNTEIFDPSKTLSLPEVWHFENYSMALQGGEILRYFLNSILYSVVTVVVSGLLAAMAAYGITRMEWKLKGFVMAVFTLGIMMPVQATLLPLFQVLDATGLRNGYLGLMIPYIVFAIPMSVMVLSSFYRSIPREMEDAACIDGCGIFRTFFVIIVPMIKPALSTASIFAFMNTWNELLFANTFVDDEAYRTLPVGIMTFVGEHSTNWGLIGAGLVVATVPVVIIYFILSRQIQSSMTVGAVKG